MTHACLDTTAEQATVPATCYLLLPTPYSLPSLLTCYFLLAIPYSLPSLLMTRYPLLTAHCSLLTAHYSPPSLHSLLTTGTHTRPFVLTL